MKKIISINLILLMLGICTLFLANCDNDYPGSLYDDDYVSKVAPEIDEVIPAEFSFAGVGEIVIKGKNFSTNIEENLVFFGGTRAENISASATELTVKSPNVVSDSLAIKIAVHGSDLFSQPKSYSLKAAVSIVGNLAGKGEVASAIASDNEDNVYISIEGKQIKKVAYDGTPSLLADVTFLKANSMKMGPDNLLYACFAAGRVKKIATIAQDGTEATFVSLSGVPSDFDFDINKNIWVAVGTDLYLVKPDKSITNVKSFSIPLGAVRVFNGFLYVSGSDENTGESKIWKCEIQDETLGAEEVVLNIAEASWMQGVTVNSFTFDIDGKMYLATDNADAILIYTPEDESHAILFPDMFLPNITALNWGDDYLYAIQHLDDVTCNILKINVGKKGAPYHGRD